MVGAGYRPELPELYSGPDGCAVDVVELVADRYFADSGFCRSWELRELGVAGIPVAIHGLCGNVASVSGPTEAYLGRIARLADAVGAVAYSDHLAFTAAGGHALGHLAPNRFDDELLECAVANIARISAATGRRVRLENLATTTMISGSTYTPEEFYRELLDASPEWDCLLDLTNIWINSQNRPLDAEAFIDSLPAERIRYIHLAGGTRHGEEWIDSHSRPVHEEVFRLLERVLTRANPDIIFIERDTDWEGAADQVRADLATVRSILAAADPIPTRELTAPRS